MSKQALIVGLGHFGMALARELSSRGVEVMAADISKERVQAASGFVADAACFDATDEGALGLASPSNRDVCICGIGDDGREASIICTALLKQLGAKRIIARSNDDVHARILRLVGADLIVNPEREFGERFARQVLHRGIRDEMRLGDNILISEIEAPKGLLGITLGELKLPAQFSVSVVAVRKVRTGSVIRPSSSTSFEEGDVLVVVGEEGAITQLSEVKELR